MTTMPDDQADATHHHRRLAEVFGVFLKLGLSSFGGPVAHLGYFRDELVTRRKWVSDQAYGDLVALCQFLPGPASSQVGFALGVLRGGGIAGGLAAWCGFTLPSALLLVAFAFGATTFTGPLANGVLHGLKLVAVAVVAHAVWGMAQSLTPDARRIAIAIAAATAALLVGGSTGQIGAIAAGAAAGLWLCRGGGFPASASLHFPVSRRSGLLALALCAILFLAPSIVAHWSDNPALRLFDAFYRAGALVFGGGHVVLPLLQAETVVPGWITGEDFLAGYGMAQAVPGPLFTFAAYLGALVVPPAQSLAGASIALVAIFLPGLLLVYGALPFWDALRAQPLAQAATRGANAAVVGILGAALYDPIWTSAVLSVTDFLLAAAGFVLLTVWRIPAWAVVLLMAAGGIMITGLSA